MVKKIKVMSNQVVHGLSLFVCMVCVTILTSQAVSAAPMVSAIQTDQAANQIRFIGSELTGIAVTVNGMSVGLDPVSDANTAVLDSVDLVGVIIIGMNSYTIDAGASTLFYSGFEVQAPPPPPPPPPLSTACPCIDGWEASGIKSHFYYWCTEYAAGTQKSFSGSPIESTDPDFFISTGFDPNNIFFDPTDVGNSVSYCALHDGVSWSVGEPVQSWEQYDNCEDWMWINVCL
jgi:hypothetical protein